MPDASGGKGRKKAAGKAPVGAVPTARQRAGALAEGRALALLCSAGLVPLARNVRYRAGELDLVMRERDTLVFVEVRARTAAGWGGAAASIDARKQQRLLHAAQLYLLQHHGNRPPPCRFDVVVIDGDGAPRWLRDAITLP